ncbi:ankyrin repeat and SAM domain-containing protein 3 [Aspergillus udagawae]|uniref:Ankyrin repeat and SAM domain-containing protein 3 n=1 Tax=Aspergillus udagawae TaxID=91492 RepID=A0ABQ1BAN6_9EURO|nr:ankyrin repeat and SAM domain-containing protein 3 [Aspergillus udagawae]
MVDMLKRTNHAGDREVKRQKGGGPDQNGAESQKKQFTHEDYTVAWVCPLEIELTAALQMLDEEHEPLPQPPTDHNIYHLGSIASYKVVIAGLWQAGNNPAIAVVTQMRIRFPNLRFALLVGIGGGVPTITDNGMLRLGHVVVSKPVGPFSGAIQYNHGKARDGVFERTGALAPPPTVLLLAAQALAAQRARSDEDHIMMNVQRIDTSKPQLRRFRFPGVENDKLFPADYKHLYPGLSCEESECDTAQCIKREIGELDQLIVVHRGTVASGELVLRDSALRDKLAKEYGVLCFEMEAAGAMADFHCLVIRGISHYCDSHNNDQWHGFAAAAAAAYARQLFFHMPIDEEKLQTIIPGTHPGFKMLVQRSHDQERQQMASWLCSTDYASQQSANLRERQDGTGQWIFETDEFRQWEREKGVLFCPGIPGAGKTILTSIVVDYLRKKHGPNNDVGLAYIFCNFQQQQNQKLDIILANILGQLVRGLYHIPEQIQAFYDIYQRNGMQPELGDVLEMLGVALGLYSHVYMMIDALDECSDSDETRNHLISHILDLQQHFNISFMATARFILAIISQFDNFPSVEIRASDADVKRYVESNLPSIVRRKPEIQNLVISEIIKKAGGMFSLARLYLDSLKGKCSITAIKKVLNKFKTGSEVYENAYEKAMKQIQQQIGDRAELAKRVLAWLTFAERTLTLTELQHALAVVIGESSFDEENLPDMEEIISSCSGLITYNEEDHIIRLVHYTTQEYLEQTWTSWFPNAHCAIGDVCVTYLCYDDFEAGRCEGEYKYEERCQKYPLYTYAAESWLYHARKQPLNHSLIGKLLMSDGKFDAWVQALKEETTPLHLAVGLGLEGEAEALLKIGHQVNATDRLLHTPLKIAVEKGHERLEKLLLRYGARPAPDIFTAARIGDESSVKYFLELGVDVNLKDKYGWTSLFHAVQEGHEGVVRLLVDAGASTDHKDASYGLTPLCLAAKNGHQAVVRLLLNEGAKPDLPDESGNTPLMHASVEGHSEVVCLLLRAGAQKDWISKNTTLVCVGRNVGEGTPLDVGVENNKKAVVRNRLAHSADPNLYARRSPLS